MRPTSLALHKIHFLSSLIPISTWSDEEGGHFFVETTVFVENVSEKSAEFKMSPEKEVTPKKGDSKTPKDVFNGLSTEEEPA